MIWSYRKLPREAHFFSSILQIKLIVTGILAFISDTIGIGSFAVMIALSKYWQLVKDKELPGLVNGAQIIPGAIEAVVFLQVIHVDMLTLITLVVGTCIGGVLGGFFVSRLNQRHIQVLMAGAFILMAVIIFLNQLQLLPIGGSATVLRGTKLGLGFLGMIVCGFVPALGVGLFALVQLLLFFLGLSPLIAFPIMTTAGALQQPLTTFTFAFNKAIPYKRMFVLSCAGVIGVLITVPLVTHLPLYFLRWLLFAIVGYNAVMMLRSYCKSRAVVCCSS